jgi:tripartite-type tricarboxylate transporter receptor subunit TctC
VPYKGAAQGLTDLAAGQVMLMFTSVLSTETIRRTGRVRVLATGGLQRSPSLPDVPTIAESGFPGFEVISWWGVLGQAAMPKDIVAKLHGELLKIMASPDAQSRIGSLGADIKTNTPGEFAAYIKSEQAKWGQVIKESGAKVD